MANNPLRDDFLSGLDPGRRDFLKRILTGTAFTVPLMASFSMEGLSVNAAEAAACAYVPYAYCSETPYDGPDKFSIQLFWLTGKKEGTKHSKLNLSLLKDGCTLKYHFSRIFDACHMSLGQLGGSFLTSTGQVEGLLGRTMEALQSGVASRSVASTFAQSLSAITPSGVGLQFSFPVAFLLSSAGFILLHHRGLLCTGPGFDVVLLMEALANGEAIVLFIQDDGIIGGGFPV